MINSQSNPLCICFLKINLFLPLANEDLDSLAFCFWCLNFTSDCVSLLTVWFFKAKLMTQISSKEIRKWCQGGTIFRSGQILSGYRRSFLCLHLSLRPQVYPAIDSLWLMLTPALSSFLFPNNSPIIATCRFHGNIFWVPCCGINVWLMDITWTSPLLPTWALIWVWAAEWPWSRISALVGVIPVAQEMWEWGLPYNL